MPSTSSRSLKSPVRLAVGLLIAGLVLAGCVGSGSGSSPAPSAAAGFYLRAWQTRALAPQYTFAWLAPVTISDGQFIDGNVAIPAIYPGPIYVGPQSRPISGAGIAAIVAEARKDGLVADKTDFSAGAVPGSILTHIQLRIDGVTRESSGPLPTGSVPDSAAPGTVAAYQRFWNQITGINAWLAADLGQGKAFTPTSLAVLVTPPIAAAGIAPTEKSWPLTSTFATFGKAFAGSAYRCGTVTGTDAASLLSVVTASNQLTRFVDSAGAQASLQVRAMLPGESDPCL